MTTSPSMTPPLGHQASATPAGRLVTDAPTRMFHALFALSFAGAYLTAESEHWRLLHVSLGYSFAALLIWRIAYGLVGPRQARLGALWRKLSSTRSWWDSVRSSPLAWATHAKQGQMLAMAWTIALMLGLVSALVLSGHAAYSEWGGAFGEEVMEEVHEFFANSFLAWVLVHIGLITVGSLLRRQNLARPMLSGRLPGHGPSPVRHNHTWLALLLAMTWAALLIWLMQAAP